MRTESDHALFSLKRELARCSFPALIADENWRIQYRNEDAAPLFYRQRCIRSLIAEFRGSEMALIVRHIRGRQTLIWVSPLRRGFREILLLRPLSEKEEAKAKRLLTAVLLDDPRWEDREPLDLSSLLDEICSKDGEDESGALWTTPFARELLFWMDRALKLITNVKKPKATLHKSGRRASLSLSAPANEGALEALGNLIHEKTDGKAQLFLRAVFSCREKRDYDLRADYREGEVCLTLSFPVKARLPVHLFQGGKRRRALRRKDQK